MKYTVVKSIPFKERGGANNELQAFLTEFMAINDKIICIDPIENGYKNIKTARGCLANAISRSRYGIKVRQRGNKIYLEKKT